MNKTQFKQTPENYIEIENKYGAHNYHPLPAVLNRGEGVFLFDVENKKYYDFLSAYSAVNQGHCHPKILESLTKQASTLTLTSRAFYNDQLGAAEQYLATIFNYDKVLLMNSGAEAVESAMKLARKWGYLKKGVTKNKARILFASSNFHGRTISIISASQDPQSREGFGPFIDGIDIVEYNNIESLKSYLENEKDCVAFIVEPIQGEAGVVVPNENYLSEVRNLCAEHNVLYIADEIQTGLARTGSLLASCGDCNCTSKCVLTENNKPDVLILGKALSGGFYPVSAVLANDEVMLCIQPGEHGSTYGGNPLACAVAKTSMQVIIDEKLAKNAFEKGNYFREKLKELQSEFPIIKTVRGKGLLNAIVIDTDEKSDLAWNLCVEFKENGLLAKPTHGNKIRFAPPLCITTIQIDECLLIIKKSLENIVVNE